MQWLWGKKKDKTDGASAVAGDSQGTVDAGTDTSDVVGSGVNDTDGKQDDADSNQPEYGSLRTDDTESDGSEDNGQHDGTTPGDESSNGPGGVGAGDEAADGTDGSGQQAQVIIERKGTGLSLLLCAALQLALAVSFVGLVTNGAGKTQVNDRQTMQADVGKISTAVNEAVDKRRAAVDKLLYDSPAPSKEQLDKLGGWKLELKQTTVGGKQHVAITNVEAPSDSKGAGKNDDEDSGVKVVWEGDVASTAAVKFSLSSPVEAAFDGGPTDKLLTRSYSITGTLSTDEIKGKKPAEAKKTASTEAAATSAASAEKLSVMALINGDADGRVGDLKFVRISGSGGAKPDADNDGKGGKSSMRSQHDDVDDLSDSLMRPRYSGNI